MQIRERVRLLGLGRCRENAHARALTLAVGFVDDLSGVAGERTQQHRVHGGCLHAAAAVKVGKDFGEDVFVHEDGNVAAVGEVLAELRARPERGHGALLRLRAVVIADPLIFVERDVVDLLGLQDVLFDLGGVLAVPGSVIRGEVADVSACGDPAAQCPFLFHVAFSCV